MAKIKCPKCGTELEEGSRFCTSCGVKLTAGSGTAAAVIVAAGSMKKTDDDAAVKPSVQADPFYKPVEPIKKEIPQDPSSDLPQAEGVSANDAGIPSDDSLAVPASQGVQDVKYPDVPVSPYITKKQPEVRKASRRSPEDKRKLKRQTVPEKILNFIGSLLLSLIIMISACSALGLEFLNQATSREGIESILKNIDVTAIAVNGKTLPETVINGFGLEYSTLSKLGIDESVINSSFANLSDLVAGRLSIVADSVKKGGDTESVVLASKEEIMQIIRNNDNIIRSLPIPETDETIYDVIDSGLVEAGFGGGLSVSQVIDSMGEVGAAQARTALKNADTAVKAIRGIKYGLVLICFVLLIVLFILNKRRLRASFFWCAVDSAVTAAGLFFIHFAWVTFRTIIHGENSALFQAIQPAAIDFTLKYGILEAVVCVISVALGIISIMVSAKMRKRQ